MKKLTLSVLLIALAGPALAHTGHGTASGLSHGLAHPLLGLDHLLAMLAVGLWSGFALTKRVWLGAAAFMSAMIAGAALSWAGIGFPMVETAITLSIVVFGLLTLMSNPGQARTLTAVSLAAIAAFALAHGHAHATEAAGSAAGYMAGFLLATGALHLVGLGLARTIAQPLVQRSLGAGVAMSGLWMMVG
ncbi:HupE/UreJ family protein [uncultured Roseovarius sp.]|uniref:HupE/UreJ family protein n=1 Tax=uncultured Roseovarius sp. TaxID=293344 RepID=UPI00263A1A3E|nr:HupE/UreJ family protein [uncultured Roseovarius sp.]